MGYYIAFVDTDRPLKSFREYEKRYCAFPDYYDANDYHVSSNKLQSLFLELKDTLRPHNGEYAAKAEEVDCGEYLDAEYIFGPDAVWVEISFQDIKSLYQSLIDIARKHEVTFFDPASGVALTDAEWAWVTTEEFKRRNIITAYLFIALCIPTLLSLWHFKWLILCCGIALLVDTYFITSHWIKAIDRDVLKRYHKV